MPIDPKKIEEWDGFFSSLAAGDVYEDEYREQLAEMALEAVPALLAEREELLADLAAVEESRDQYAALARSYERSANDDLARRQAIADMRASDREAALLSLLREVEWSRPAGVDGCLDSCPVCRAWKHETYGRPTAHRPGCRLAAFLGKGPA